jgi:hypothetical protein
MLCIAIGEFSRFKFSIGKMPETDQAIIAAGWNCAELPRTLFIRKIWPEESNEIFRNPMRGYSSNDGGAIWVGQDLPLPPTKCANSSDFGSDPSLAFDSQGNLFYSYIVVFFGNGKTEGRQPFPGRWLDV